MTIPTGLSGEKGVIRFMLNPSDSDGIVSRVMLGGFGVFDIPADTVHPTTTALLSGSAGSNGWYIVRVTVALSASDNLSGVAVTQYRLDGGSHGRPTPAPSPSQPTESMPSIFTALTTPATSR